MRPKNHRYALVNRIRKPLIYFECGAWRVQLPLNGERSIALFLCNYFIHNTLLK